MLSSRATGPWSALRGRVCPIAPYAVQSRDFAYNTTKGHRQLKGSAAHTKSMLRNLVSSLFEHERIETTLPKAHETQVFAERMLTLGKRGGLHHRRKALGFIRTEELVHKVFNEYAQRYATRNGGYTRVIKTRRRYGDNAQMAFIELVRPSCLATCFGGGLHARVQCAVCGVCVFGSLAGRRHGQRDPVSAIVKKGASFVGGQAGRVHCAVQGQARCW